MAIARPTTKTIISTTGWGVPITDEVNRLSPIVDGRTPTAWTAVVFANGWVNLDAPRACQYRKIGDMVYMSGCMASGTMGATAFTLPAGFRPRSNIAFITQISGGVGNLTILSSGAVNVTVASTGTNGFAYIDPGIFYAAG